MTQPTGQIGVSAFLPNDCGGDIVIEIELIRSDEGKSQQIWNVAEYQALRSTPERLGDLQNAAQDRTNVFTALMKAVKSCSLGQIHMRFTIWLGVLAEYVISGRLCRESIKN